MDTGKFVGLLVFGIIGIIVLAAFVPLISETTSSTKTFENKDYFFTMDKITADDDTTHTVVWAVSDPTKLVIDGVDYYPNWSGTVTVVALEDDLIRSLSYADGYWFNFIGQDAVNGSGYFDHTSLTASLTSGVLTWTGELNGNTYTRTSTYDEAYMINPKGTGAFVMKTPTSSAYVLEDSLILGMGLSTFGGSGNNLIRVSGNVTELTASVVSTPLGSDITIGDLTITSTELTDYRGLYTFDKVEFPVTIEDTTTTITYSYVIVPAEVTAEKSYHPDNTLATVINLLPLIAVIGLFMFLVAEFLYTRYL